MKGLVHLGWLKKPKPLISAKPLRMAESPRYLFLKNLKDPCLGLGDDFKSYFIILGVSPKVFIKSLTLLAALLQLSLFKDLITTFVPITPDLNHG